ncbi:type IV toxin-antitoxin system AbiEi family antitoxin domain-containing protein [Isoptericola sp. NPDC055881]
MPRRILVPASLERVAASQDGLVSTRQCQEHGMTSSQVKAHVRQGRWQRVMRGVLDTTWVAAGHHDRHDPLDSARRREAICGLLAYPGSVATGVAALVLLGAQGAPRRIAPEVTFPDGSPRTGGGRVRVRRERLRRWVVVGGLPCVPGELALAQAVPDLDRRHAVALMDSARQRRVVTEDEFRRARDAARGRRGAARTRTWWDVSDPRAESPIETAARLACADAGCPPDALQLVVRDARGRFLARVDLAWILPAGRVLLVELDGRDVHTAPGALFGDRRRQNELAARGALVLRFTGRDVAQATVENEIRKVLDSEGWTSQPWPAGRSYSLSPTSST